MIRTDAHRSFLLLWFVVIVALGLVATESPYVLPSWAQWLGLVAAVVAALGIVGIIGRWFRVTINSYEVAYTDANLSADVKERITVVRTGEAQTVYIRIRVRASGGIDFGEIVVRPIQRVRTFFSTGLKIKFTKFQTHDGSAIRVVALDDALPIRFGGPVIHPFVARPHLNAPGIVGEFTPPYRRLKGEPLYLGVGISATRSWRGHLGLQLPNAAGSRTWHFIPIEARP